MTMRRPSAGFTLIEVLIGTTVLAIMMTLLTSALFTMTRSARAGEARLQELDSTQLAHAFLRRQLQNAFPLTEREDGDERALFEGLANRLRFVGHLPIAEGGGLQFLEIAATDGALEMRYRDAWPDAPFTSPNAEWRSRTLVPDVERVRWRYFGAADDKAVARWTDEWVRHDRLPELIRVELEHGDRSVTTLLAEVRVPSAVARAALFRAPPEDAP
jgi:prepilin-type N-terminal cleavage/methylation domain-containing protein